MICTPERLSQIPSRYPADLGFDVLPRLVGQMLGYPISDYLLDIGTLENYQAAQNTWPGLTASGEIRSCSLQPIPKPVFDCKL
jgi:NDP-sugar pyrophosphorylase family protein